MKITRTRAYFPTDMQSYSLQRNCNAFALKKCNLFVALFYEAGIHIQQMATHDTSLYQKVSNASYGENHGTDDILHVILHLIIIKDENKQAVSQLHPAIRRRHQKVVVLVLVAKQLEEVYPMRFEDILPCEKTLRDRKPRIDIHHGHQEQVNHVPGCQNQ